MEDNKVRIGITHGDINGIGYEVIIKTLADPRILELCTPVIYGSSKVAAYHRKTIEVNNFNLNVINSADEINPKRANIINCIDEEIKVELSKSTEVAGEAAFLSLEKATEDLKEGLIDALITAPINKNNIQSERFDFPGHTEYLEGKFGQQGDSLMLMINDVMRVAVVTTHLPLSKVSGTITKDLILSKIRRLHRALVQDFGVNLPRIAVLGLNPHAGDGGLLGEEEQEIIMPAIKEAENEGIVCVGPYAADGFFGSGSFAKYDAVLAMYHDQGLIPFKCIAMETGVNYTAGLSVVRTSPAHGTAYDIAGKNMASEESFRQALYAACDIFRNRKTYEEITANPLTKDTENLL